MKTKLALYILLYLLFCPICCAGSVSLRGRVADASDGEPVAFCNVVLLPGDVAVQTREDGCFDLPAVRRGRCSLSFVCLGYRKVELMMDLAADTFMNVQMYPEQHSLKEVVITAKESVGLASSSRIDREAMQHLQPTSFTDILELLPGNISKNPDMGAVNSIALRETGNIGANGRVTDNPDYAISSLGTLFVVDGAPVSTDACMLSVGASGDGSAAVDKRSIMNKGIDMRSISTDNIESVEIIRGVPSAEYGNLTSGMVNIRRISCPTPLSVRFKADEYSKLFSVGKGFAFKSYDHVATVDLSWLDSKIDPRDNLENYRRLTASARMAMNFNFPDFAASWRYGVDYTASLDDTKTDPDLSLTKVDEYKSSYRRLSFNNSLLLKFIDFKPLSQIELSLSAAYVDNRLERRKQVAPAHASIAPTSTKPGVSEGHFLLGEYIADYICDDRPFDVFAKLKLAGSSSFSVLANDYKAGAEWSLAKNFGCGQVYDLTKPLSASWTVRPRRYSDIPSLQQLSFFAEDNMSLYLDGFNIEAQMGLRALSSPGIDSRYELSGKVYLDPRLNLALRSPEVFVASLPLSFVIAAGYGITTKLPTIDYLYPQDSYNDFIQMSYYDVNDPVGGSKVSLMTYVDSAVNYGLRAARNLKREIRLGASYGGNRLSVTFFSEKMNSGFRYTNIYMPYHYRRYDASAYQELSVLDAKRMAGNGTRIDKRGVEFQLNTVRWMPVRTSLTVTGAWFRSVYSNSQMLYMPVSEVIGGEVLSNRYVGIYDSDDGRVNDQFNTNFMFDTQIPGLGLVFSTTLQCMWWVKTTRLRQNGVPVAYVSSDGTVSPFDTAEAASDPYLSHLIKVYNDEAFRTQRIPEAIYLNFKATKNIGRCLRMAVFVNRIIDYLPDYKSNGLTVRRNSDAYFGMELNITI